MQQERYRNVETYSTGMRQKIKFACAIVHDPVLLIFDEPTSGLDPEERESLLNRIRVLARDFEKTVIISTHILPDVQSTCDHVMILSRGKLRVSDTLESLSCPASPTITIQVVEGANRIVEQLSQSSRLAKVNSHHHSTAVLNAVMVNDNELKVDGEIDEVSAAIWAAAAKSSTHIKSMKPARNSLQEIFIQAIRESGHADA
jgi:ABC-2 type transport system ATP-binding protein